MLRTHIKIFQDLLPFPPLARDLQNQTPDGTMMIGHQPLRYLYSLALVNNVKIPVMKVKCPQLFPLVLLNRSKLLYYIKSLREVDW